MSDSEIYEAYLIISKLKKEKKELEFKLNTLKKWYKCQNCTFSEEELKSYYERGYDGRKYRSNSWAFKLGIKLYTMLGLDHRIRK